MKIWIILFFLTFNALSPGKTDLPEAPVQCFRLPIFGPNGFKRWDLTGKEGLFSPDSSQVSIEGMRLSVFDGSADLKLEATLESPSAIFYTKTKQAEGSGFLFLTTPHYTAVGHGWTWAESKNTDTYRYQVCLKSDVRVVFKNLNLDWQQAQSINPDQSADDSLRP